MSRKTISIDEDLHDRLDQHKGDDESWTDFVERLYEAAYIEGRDDERTVRAPLEDVDEADIHTYHDAVEELHDEIASFNDQLEGVLTEEHIDDIANVTSTQTGKEIENRMTPR
ncbi:hypothetical protein PhiCh1p97 [Natrialba phage PhiCh1]|uniref:DUF217 family protein phiCh1-VP96 n=2 Tax=root TaxID=1 RepID=D3T2E7_NATMM|nr:antitoxin VapB family protein [Natrialba magadii]NP_666014.1 hypothetical protein PhiCh1p97 [Natrialba phage PhiCh1]YP_010078123.1 DUF217 domain protein [Natrialba phage PhiCh1]AAM88769.1 unknown [Natrialba phage PhiCh1]ADD07756.1 DUF217 family protein phiCh1-VP96 [Natrialba magadii ATCC 43099]ELY23003.1 hypothetical protein C500_21105 [Natrialba magadii ATCC 43099]QBJ01274.1 DUF217 domain protein [Natrialba phage PhiCh1]